MLQLLTDFLFQYDCHFKRITPKEKKRKSISMLNLTECNTSNNSCFSYELKCESSLKNVFHPLGITSQVISHPHVLKQTFHVPRGNIGSIIPGLSHISMSHNAVLKDQVLIHYRYSLLIVSLENIHIMLILSFLVPDLDKMQVLTEDRHQNTCSKYKITLYDP